MWSHSPGFYITNWLTWLTDSLTDWPWLWLTVTLNRLDDWLTCWLGWLANWPRWLTVCSSDGLSSSLRFYNSAISQSLRPFSRLSNNNDTLPPPQHRNRAKRIVWNCATLRDKRDSFNENMWWRMAIHFALYQIEWQWQCNAFIYIIAEWCDDR